jgi:hypothetical protein
MKFALIARRSNEAAFAAVTILFVLMIPHLGPKQAVIAATLLVLAFAVLSKPGRLLSLFVTAIVVTVATVGIVFLVGRW